MILLNDRNSGIIIPILKIRFKNTVLISFKIFILQVFKLKFVYIHVELLGL